MNKKQVVLIAAIIAFIAGLVIISMILNNGTNSNNAKAETIKIIEENQFEEFVLKADKPVLEDFYTDWCGPCKVLSPTIEELSQDNNYKDKYYFYKVNVDYANNIATVIIFKDGTEMTRSSGVVEKDYIVDMLKQGLE